MIGKYAKSLVLAVSLAGCGGVIVEDYPGPRGNYADGDLDYATRNGAIVTTISGNPFNDFKAAFDARVLSHMKGQNRGVPAEFVVHQDERTDPAYQVVVVFNPLKGTTADSMCREPNLANTGPASDTLVMAIAFCHGRGAVSGTVGRVSGVTSVEDPRFAELVAAVTSAMIPDSDGLEDDGDDGNPIQD